VDDNLSLFVHVCSDAESLIEHAGLNGLVSNGHNVDPLRPRLVVVPFECAVNRSQARDTKRFGAANEHLAFHLLAKANLPKLGDQWANAQGRLNLHG
jgi:hypothetical protein